MTSNPDDLKRLQTNLAVIRKIAGWSAEKLGRKIGVTKQTISNLENHKTPLSLTQYIAIRSVLDYEVAQNPGNTLLPAIIKLLLDDRGRDEFDANERRDVDEAVETLAAASSGGLGLKSLSSLATKLLGGVAAATATGVALSWLSEVFDDD